MSLILRLQYCLSANGISTNLSQETICASSRLRNLTGQADDLENNKQTYFIRFFLTSKDLQKIFMIIKRVRL